MLRGPCRCRSTWCCTPVADGEGKAEGERRRGAAGERAAQLDERHAEAGEWPELRSHDHRADDEDRAVEEDADCGDDGGEDHVEQEDGGELDAFAGALVELFPDDRVGGRPGRVLLGCDGEVGSASAVFVGRMLNPPSTATSRTL